MKSTMEKEVWDIFDSERNHTGHTIRRGERLLPGQYHLVVHIWPQRPDGSFLIQRRADDLDWMPGIWATTGGSAVQGEDSITAAIRETREELGIQLALEWLSLKFTQQRTDSFADVWIAKIRDIDLSSLELEKAVAEVKWADFEEIIAMVKEQKFLDCGEWYFQALIK
jgi:8-oxo-dGTP diphosphatase